MGGASKIYQENFGFGLGTILFLTSLATQIYVNVEESWLKDDDSTGFVNYEEMMDVAHHILKFLSKSPSAYCSVLLLYHF
jgi:hypothetical protein